MSALALPALPLRTRRVLPGLGLTLGLTMLYLAIVVMLPLGALMLQAAEVGPDRLWSILTGRRTLAAFRITLTAAALATVINAAYGLLMAWVLTRYEFPGKRLLDALMDVPFALPTAVAGLSLSALYAGNGWFGAVLEPLGIKVNLTLLGVALAMSFTSVPFVVRTVQPVLEDLDPKLEEAARTLGASRPAIFARVVFPIIFPAFLAGSALAFARSLGEFGAIVFIAGNLPMRTEIASLLVFIRLEEFDYPAAAAIACTLLLAAFLLLLLTNAIQFWSLRYKEARA
jgi:sulfate transport system permease protein